MYETTTGPVRRWSTTLGVVGFITVPPFRSRPHTAYRFLRRFDPVHESPLGIWVLAGHREVTAALRHPALGTDESKIDIASLRLGPLRRRFTGSLATAAPRSGDARGLLRQLMLFRDPPDHTRLRSLVNKVFTAKAIAGLEPRISEIVHGRLDALARQRSVDFLAEVAYPVPALVICEMLGVPPTDYELIVRHAPAIAARLDPSPMRSATARATASAATEALTTYLADLIVERRKHLGDDLLSRMIAAEDGGTHLDQEELVAMTVLLLIAGHETTANLLGNGLLALLKNPQQWDRFRHDLTVDQTTVEELMRYDGPIQATQRVTLEDIELPGMRVPKGRLLILCLAAANRDASVFTNPHALRIDRDPNPHLGFGSGTHFCLGTALARLETRLVLRAVAERLPNVALAATRPRWRPSFTIRGLKELPLTW